MIYTKTLKNPIISQELKLTNSHTVAGKVYVDLPVDENNFIDVKYRDDDEFNAKSGVYKKEIDTEWQRIEICRDFDSVEEAQIYVAKTIQEVKDKLVANLASYIELTKKLPPSTKEEFNVEETLTLMMAEAQAEDPNK